MRYYKILLLTIILSFLMSCEGKESSFDCFGASSPIDLTLNNNRTDDQVLSLFNYSEEEGFNPIGTLKVEAKSQKTICIENEGPVEEGLYLYNGGQTFKIKLTWGENFILNLDDSTHLIQTPSELANL